MDEPLRSILTAIGTILAGVLAGYATFLVGKINSRKDVTKLAIETDSQRNRSEETFRQAFADEKNKTERLEKRVRYLIKRDKERDIKMNDLIAQVADVNLKLDGVIKERDDALEKLKGMK